MGFPFFSTSGQPTFGFAGCGQPVGLGGKQMTIPVSYPIDMQYVASQVTAYLNGRGFQVNPMVSPNMAIIQARHTSLFGYLTDSNKAYTIRICQGAGTVFVETGISNWLQELLPLAAAGGFAFFSDMDLHNKLLTLLGIGGAAFDAYHVYQNYAQEDQLLNFVAQVVSSAPPAQGFGGQMQGYPGGYPPGGGYPPPY
ncbi:MAG: hypothetical protein RXR43_05645 [Sulfolobus sp.]